MRAQEFINEISDEQLQRYLSRANQQVDRRQERMARVRDRLNKGYEIYHAETPNKIVDRFEANTPQEAKRYYDDFITKYESDVDYDLRFRRATGIMEEQLDEEKTPYKEIEFVCVNPDFPEATDPEVQKQLYRALDNIVGVIPLWQDWSDGQVSLTAIYRDPSVRNKILAMAERLGVDVDIEQAVSRDYVQRAIDHEHEGQISENFADGKVKGKSRPGRVKRAGASCKGSVTDLRAKARKYGGEKGKMYHWCANMKAGKSKAK
jgi:hypothetical protein